MFFFILVAQAFQTRLSKLKEHHDRCAFRYQHAEVERRRALLLSQRARLDRQLAELDDEVSNISYRYKMLFQNQTQCCYYLSCIVLYYIIKKSAHSSKKNRVTGAWYGGRLKK